MNSYAEFFLLTSEPGFDLQDLVSTIKKKKKSQKLKTSQSLKHFNIYTNI